MPQGAAASSWQRDGPCGKSLVLATSHLVAFICGSMKTQLAQGTRQVQKRALSYCSLIIAGCDSSLAPPPSPPHATLDTDK